LLTQKIYFLHAWDPSLKVHDPYGLIKKINIQYILSSKIRDELLEVAIKISSESFASPHPMYFIK